MMLVVPLVFIPLLITVTSKISISQHKKATERVLKISIVSNGNASDFVKLLKEQSDLKVNEAKDIEVVKESIRKSKTDFGIVFDDNFDKNLRERRVNNIQLHYRFSSEMKILKNRIVKILDSYKSKIIENRLSDIGKDISFITPFNISENDLASQKERIGKTIGGFLPYLFIIFSFLGAFYPAIDLAAGEKERGTIETLLVSPANRLQIVLGKFLVVMQASLMSAVVGFIGMYIAVQQLNDVSGKLMNILLKILEFKSIALVLSLLIPISIFFAAILLSLSIYAKSFKEAQSIMTPLNFMVIAPAAIGMMPGIKLTAITAMIPILNISLASKEVLAGTIKTGLLVETYLSLFVLAGITLYFCTQWFKREDVIFRGV
jgi:sodium transport system permease protein